MIKGCLWLIGMLLLGGQGCHASPREPFTPEPTLGSLGQALLTLSVEAQRSLLPQERALAAGETRRQLAQLATVIRQAQARRPQDHLLEVMNRVVFGEEKFERVLDAEALAAMLLPQVLATRRGNCLGLSALYLALAEMLSLQLSGVLVPNHFFLRYEGRGGSRNVELLKEGTHQSRRWYEDKYQVPPQNSLYLRTLGEAETLAVFRYNLANVYLHRSELARAQVEYQKVVAVLPLFAEAQANLGLTYQLQGRPEQARRAYYLAQWANSRLPGLQHNQALLQGEGSPR
jgi:regulator of sirC expression with transglutaminase-like and TPR domain